MNAFEQARTHMARMDSTAPYRHLDLTALRLILFLADGGGLSYASMKLGIPMSSASYKLRRFEHDLGASLFVRQGRSLTLSQAAAQYVEMASELLACNDRFFSKEHAMARIGLSDAFLGILGFNEVLELTGMNVSDIKPRLVIMPNQEIIDLVVRDKLDFALFWDAEGESSEHWLMSHPLRWVGSRQPGPGVFTRLPCIYRSTVEQALRAGAHAPLSVDVCVDTVQQALSLVSDAGGVTIATELHLRGTFSNLECLGGSRPVLPEAHLHLFSRDPSLALRRRLRNRLKS